MIERQRVVEGGLKVGGNIQVMGGINSMTYRRTVTKTAKVAADVTVVEGRVDTAEEDIVNIDERVVVVEEEVAQIPARVVQYAPKYLGKYEASHPVAYNPGDWWTVYDTDDSPIQRGVWWSNAGTPERITTASAVALRAKLAEAMPDVAWAEAQTTYGTSTDYGISNLFSELAAVSALITTLVAKQAFIESLFSQEIVVPDGGTIRYYNGAGVQRRAVQMADDRIDWLDTPDGGNELPVASFGRLGVSNSLLIGGEVYSETVQQWNPETPINSQAFSGRVSVISMASGASLAVYTKADNSLYQREKTAGTWGSETGLGIVGYYPDAKELADGRIVVAFTASSNKPSIVFRTSGTWGDPVEIGQEANSNQTVCVEEISVGQLLISYHKPNTQYLAIRTYSGATIGDELVISDFGCKGYSIKQHQGVTHISAIRSSDYYLVEFLDNGAGFDSGTVLISASTGSPRYYIDIGSVLFLTYIRSSIDSYIMGLKYTQDGYEAAIEIFPYTAAYGNISLLNDGSLMASYRSSSTAYLVERTLRRYSQLGAGIIENYTDVDGNQITKWSDGRIEIEKTITSASRAVISAYAEGFYITEQWSLPSGVTAVSWADCKYVSSARLLFCSIRSISTSLIEFYMMDMSTSATSNFDIKLKMVGRWK